MTIVEFLSARLDEIEAMAEAATPGPWISSGTVLAGVITPNFKTVAECNADEWSGGEYSYPADAEESANSVHIAQHDPAYVLADVASKRSIIAACNYDGMTAEYVLQSLARPFADHPDFDPAWAV